MKHTRARLTAAVTAVALALAGALAFAFPASAHNFYVSSTPATDAVLTSLPAEFTVTTNDKLLELGDAAGGFFMQVRGPEGLYYGDGCVTVSGASVSMTAAIGPAGDYSLDWQVVSADGHTVSGQIPFSWNPGPDAGTPSRGFTDAPVCGVEPEPIASETPEASATETPSASDDAVADSPVVESDSSSVIVWIAGGIGALAIAAIAAMLLIRPKKK